MNGALRTLEVATVPDFSGEAAGLFEARTLFFLASWLEWQARSTSEQRKDLRLALCCVGNPPKNVRRLAERAGAVVTVHAPVAGFWGGFANKLRGLEGVASGARRLVLDADVLVLGEPHCPEVGNPDFAAAPAGKPQVPQALWERLYAALKVPLPRERMASLRGRLGLGLEEVSIRYEGQREEAQAMLPYYNSGVLLARGDTGLRERWEFHLRRVLEIATADPEMIPLHALMYGDQVGLATALQSLRAEGRTFALLPDAWNARLAHLRAGALQWQEIRLFHATGFLRGLQRRDDLPSLVERYAARWSEAFREGTTRQAGAADDAAEPERFLQTLWERWVRAEW